MSTAAAAGVASLRPQRTALIALCFAAVFICYVDRVNISLAIVAMAREFGWNKTTSGFVMSSFFIGYLLTQVPGGVLAGRFGGKHVLAGGVILWSLFTALTPPAAYAGFGALIAARILMGMGEGVTFPSIYALFARWVPASRRSRAVGLVFSAIPLGVVSAQLATPVLVTSFGWPWAFYAFAALGLVWWAAWQPLTTSSPAAHPRVSEAELRELAARSRSGRSGLGAVRARAARKHRGVGDRDRALLQQLGRLRDAVVGALLSARALRRRLPRDRSLRDGALDRVVPVPERRRRARRQADRARSPRGDGAQAHAEHRLRRHRGGAARAHAGADRGDGGRRDVHEHSARRRGRRGLRLQPPRHRAAPRGCA